MQVVVTVLLSIVAVWLDRIGVVPTTGATFVMQHQDVSEVAPILDVVLTGTCCSRIGAVAPPAASTPMPPALRVDADLGRNALHFRGRPEAVRAAIALVLRLDVPAEGPAAR